MTPITFVVAGDPEQRTGGYRYDARIVAGLRELGHPVSVAGLEGRFPEPDARAARALERALDACADGACVIVDGLVLGGLAETARAHADRLRLIALVHHPLADETGLTAAASARLLADERAALAVARAVVVTSGFTARRLVELGLAAAPPRVIEPGTDPAPVARGSDGPGCRLLCVATVTPRKGHAVLLDALARLADRDWHCDVVGSLDREPAHAACIRARIDTLGLGARVHLHGDCNERELAAAYDRADLFVLASHYEGYGMVVTEALARGLPLVTTNGGALADTVPARAARTAAPGDVAALAAALGSLLDDPAALAAVRRGALAERERLRRWRASATEFSTIVEALADDVPA
ncbi:glycosyltransferase family 4 protein [Salinisphaera orenii]|uniref:glycosyltransferase family 4 protein n=1 Tax=Salinisphaera orenii TaxID=856731 RepID=UPI000F4B73B6|nr:glycosyltransferase family 4 protein [Salinisphaera orenii]